MTKIDFNEPSKGEITAENIVGLKIITNGEGI